MEQHLTHFMRLAEAFQAAARTQEPVPATIQQLADILCCTPRNVKFILRKFEEWGYIRWQPGRGRGHVSQLTFLRGADEVMENALEELIGKGKIKQGIELIGQLGGNGPLKERLFTLVNRQMGYHSEAETTTGLDILRISLSRRLEKLDPLTIYTAFEAYLLGQLCSTLVTFDPAARTFQPALAHMWEANEEHTSYIFYLRKGVRFHHSRVLTSRDVKETYQRLKDMNSPALAHFRDIERVEMLGDHRICFNLSRPNLFFLHSISSVYMSILPYDIDLTKELIGTGPYRMADMNKDVLVLAAFDDYFGIRPLLDRVEIWYLPDMGSGVRQYELPNVPDTDSAAADCGNSVDYSALGCRYILFNFHKEGIHHQPEFRRALRELYHPPAMMKELGGKRIVPAASFLPWESRAWEWTEPSDERIREWLRASGYNGEEITLSYVRTKEEESEEAHWLQRRAEAAGIRLRLRTYSSFQIEEVLSQADLVVAEEVLEDDWEWGMINYFLNQSNLMHSLLGPGQLERLHRELEDFTALPEAGRSVMLKRAEAILHEECWMLYGCHMNKRAQLNQSLFGLHTGPFGFLDISRLWIKTAYDFGS